MLEARGGAAVASVRQTVNVLGLVQALAEAGEEGPVLAIAASAFQQHAASLDAASFPSSGPTAPLQWAQGTDGPRLLACQPRLCALWKPPGWSVTVAYDEMGGSGQPARAPEARDGPALQDWLVQELGSGSPIARNADVAHGLLHRLDRDTSGALLWARSYSGYFAGRLQLAARRIRKAYVCLCQGWAPAAPFSLELPLLKLAQPGRTLRSVISPRGRPSRTEVSRAGHLRGPQGERLSLLEVQLHTGRLHQIRAHLASQGLPLAGDAIYGSGAAGAAWCPRQFLHACALRVDIGDGPLDVTVPLPEDLCQVLAHLEPVDRYGAALRDRWLR